MGLEQAARQIIVDWDSGIHLYEAITALRESLVEQAEQAEQEPVAWAISHSLGLEFGSKYPMQETKEAAEQMARQHMGAVVVTPLYAAPVQQAEQEPVGWSDDIAAMPFNTYCRAVVNWSSHSTCGESYLEGNEVEVVVVKYGMTEGSAYEEPKPRFVFLHTGTNQYKNTSVHVLKWKPL